MLLAGAGQTGLVGADRSHAKAEVPRSRHALTARRHIYHLKLYVSHAGILAILRRAFAAPFKLRYLADYTVLLRNQQPECHDRSAERDFRQMKFGRFGGAVIFLRVTPET